MGSFRAAGGRRSYNRLNLEYFRRPEDVCFDGYGAVDGHGVRAVRVDEELDGRLEVLSVEVGDDEYRPEQIGHLVTVAGRTERYDLSVHLPASQNQHTRCHIIETRSHPETVGDMSRVTLNFDLSKIPFVHF